VFTGLVQTLGLISVAGKDEFKISPQTTLENLAIGDSVAVDGVCLTVETIMGNDFIATASPETLKRTILGQAIANSTYVNLETSLRAGGKIGGHFVTGHIDGLGSLIESINTNKAWEMVFAAPPNLTPQWHQYISRYIVSKGSIAVNGISLTVAECDDQGNWFKTAVIPHTYQETNLSLLKTGDLVNIEGDILGKYVEKLLKINPHQQDISLSFLTENGYL
jgi:riboflavin synthase